MTSFGGSSEEKEPMLTEVEDTSTDPTSTDPSLHQEKVKKDPPNGRPCVHHGSDLADRPVSKNVRRAQRKLLIACVLSLLFLIAEFVGGYIGNSLAIMTDAAHLLSDFASFLISLLAIWLATRPSTSKMSYGWHRLEVMGAMFSILLIWMVTGILVHQAIDRMMSGEHHVNADIMLTVAACGVAINIIMGLVLGFSHGHSHGHDHGHSHKDSQSQEHDHVKKKKITLSKPSVKQQVKDENVNVRAALIHAIGDLCQSFGVLVAAVLIKIRPDFSIADPICTIVFSVIVLITTMTLLRDAIWVLMEGTPRGVDLDEIKESLLDIDGVETVHDIHVWSLTVGTTALSAHLTIDSEQDAQSILSEATEVVSVMYHIKHSTIQVENIPCTDKESDTEVEIDERDH